MLLLSQFQGFLFSEMGIEVNLPNGYGHAKKPSFDKSSLFCGLTKVWAPENLTLSSQTSMQRVAVSMMVWNVIEAEDPKPSQSVSFLYFFFLFFFVCCNRVGHIIIISTIAYLLSMKNVSFCLLSSIIITRRLSQHTKHNRRTKKTVSLLGYRIFLSSWLCALPTDRNGFSCLIEVLASGLDRFQQRCRGTSIPQPVLPTIQGRHLTLLAQPRALALSAFHHPLHVVQRGSRTVRVTRSSRRQNLLGGANVEAVVGVDDEKGVPVEDGQQ